MNDREHDELWDLLGKARQPVASSFFARNVLRAVRGQQRQGWLGWTWSHWRLGALTASAAAIAMLAVVHMNGDSEPVLTADTADYEVIADLDELLAYENTSLWLDNDSTQ